MISEEERLLRVTKRLEHLIRQFYRQKGKRYTLYAEDLAAFLSKRIARIDKGAMKKSLGER